MTSLLLTLFVELTVKRIKSIFLLAIVAAVYIQSLVVISGSPIPGTSITTNLSESYDVTALVTDRAVSPDLNTSLPKIAFATVDLPAPNSPNIIITFLSLFSIIYLFIYEPSNDIPKLPFCCKIRSSNYFILYNYKTYL